MSKLDNVANKLDKHLNSILKVILEKCDLLERENRIYRKEVLRLEKIQGQLINVIGEKVFLKKLADKTGSTKLNGGVEKSG